ncbi:DeoR/GlpR family DNA-binding transcription regulator [Pectinatus haikarae]|uniref:Lactose phosphotransferase system repressor n=1 Tax=Pectinatus haikarae TaxID=349096 RepID=A0ABT9Y5U6_9FIRM|nr:DeoR/GlpR family DNA-binding transcription regulator [Pectinatus haikarae]MDQ0202890.1 DeoR/GlpR family transcriptional regulator of sugar metabolism [Pectinatus haikarae]
MKNILNDILEILIAYKKIDVVELSKKLQISQVTIRKYLTKLESTGMVKREHGYAVLHNEDDIAGRLAYHYNSKIKIAKRAVELVKDGDTIMIENGSCCALLALELAAVKNNLTIVTNSTYIAKSLRQRQASFQIIILGGLYQEKSECLVGPMIRANAENYNVEFFFIGTDGYNRNSGFANKDQMRSQAVRDMANSCDKLIILTESEKFGLRGTIPLNIKNIPQILITDSKIPKDIFDELRQRDVQVITV